VPMTVLPRALGWQRTDITGGEFTTFDDRRGLVARGWAFATDPVTYGCRYEIVTDDTWVSSRFEATAEGAGWRRTVKMERAAGRWRVTTAEQGDLEALIRSAPFPGSEDPNRLTDALDIDLYASPLTNTLPIRRLGLHRADPGTRRTITAAWILLPSLAVIPLEQTYTVLAPGRVNYASEGFTADIDIDVDGYVKHYPGLATLGEAR
jgi:uncharacterized protein